MVTKVNGAAGAGEHLTGNMQFFAITTDVNILPVPTGNAVTQAKLDKLVEVISLNGQPVIMGAPVEDTGNYIFKFATEHAGAWTAASLETAILDHAGHLGFTGNGVAIVVTETL